MSERTPERILPREAGAAPLDLVIGVMAFLAALALGGMLIANRTAESWQAGLLGRLTVQVLPQGDRASDEEVRGALRVLRKTDGVMRARILSHEESLALVEPWIGRDAVVAALPFPALIDVRLSPGTALDVTDLEARLKAAAPNAVLDDHARWVARLKSTAGAVLWSALAILVLIAIATAATVAFATRAGLAAHSQIVQLLHLMGARDGFISRAFEGHYLVAALVTSACGMLAALALYVVAGSAEAAGLASVPFLPPLGLKLAELPWLALVPAAVSLIAWLTARLSVFSALRKIY
ncbi:MAG: cell division protein FtsX [Alphaproteobacteria bacterium]